MNMPSRAPHFTTRLARDGDDLRDAQRLRYEVFVEELGAGGDMVDHAARLERDRFDDHFDHMILRDEMRARQGLNPVVGVYRLLDCTRARQIGQFYSEDEYDLGPLKRSGRRLLELGRSCLHRDYRGGTAMYHLWTGLADYVQRSRAEILFGVASFHGTDPQALAQPLSLLHQRHLAPPELRVRAHGPGATPMDLCPPEAVDRRQAMLQIPALIKAYLRLGGCVGEGAFIDRDFNTVDVCLVMDTARMNARQSQLYQRDRQG